jgi:hypothetical protein
VQPAKALIKADRLPAKTPYHANLIRIAWRDGQHR